MIPPFEPHRSLLTDSRATRIRADKWVAEHFPDHSRSQVQRWFAEDRVLRDGVPLKTRDTLPPGCTVDVYPMEKPTQAPPRGEDLPLEILYEDASLIAVNKPPGMVSHPATGHSRGTLIHALLHRYPDLADVGDPSRPGLAHRLDADTSGVMVFGRTPAALQELQRQFHDRETRKEYQCLVHGVPSTAEGDIRLPIGRHPVDRKRRAVNGVGAREAYTHYRMEEGLARGHAARFLVRIHTGRTHQIRVHLAHIGHPVLGDTVYGGKRARARAGWPPIPRQMLHAFRLRLTHPDDNIPLQLEAPIPDDMLHIIQQLHAWNP